MLYHWLWATLSQNKFNKVFQLLIFFYSFGVSVPEKTSTSSRNPINNVLKEHFEIRVIVFPTCQRSSRCISWSTASATTGPRSAGLASSLLWRTRPRCQTWGPLWLPRSTKARTLSFWCTVVWVLSVVLVFSLNMQRNVLSGWYYYVSQKLLSILL